MSLDELRSAATARLREASQTATGPTDAAVLHDQVISAVITDHTTQTLRTDGRVLASEEAARIQQVLRAHLTGMGGLTTLLADESIEDIWINGCDQVFVARHDGTTERVDAVCKSDEALVELVRTIAAGGGTTEQERRFDRSSPILDLQLPGGARLNAVMSLTARPCVSIRRHRIVAANLPDLVRGGTMSREIADLLRAAVAARSNIIVAGATGAGKTTLLKALAAEIPEAERLITIEDTLELGLDADPRHPNAIAMQSRPPNLEGHGGVTLRQLFTAALRMHPSRVMVGEVRGAEVIPMLHAMSQGNNGSLSTIHTSSSAGVFTKLALLGAEAPERLGSDVMAQLIAESVDLIVHMTLSSDKRRVVASVREVTGADACRVVSNEIYRPDQDGAAVFATPLSRATAQRLEPCGYRTPTGGGWA